MDDAARAALHALDAQSGSDRPTRLAEQAESLGYTVLAPRSSGTPQHVRLVREAAGRPDVTVYLHATRLAVQAKALRDVASSLPGADVTSRDVQFSYDKVWAGDILAAFVDGTAVHAAPGAAPTPRAKPRPPWERAAAAPVPVPPPRKQPTPSSSVWLAVVAGVALLLVVLGIVIDGIGGGLVMAGVAVGVVGLAAVIAGQARWARIANRGVGAVLVASGLAAVLIGGATLPTTPSSDSSTAAPATTTAAPTTSSPTDDEAAIAAAEAALAAAEDAETTGATNVTAGLDDAAADGAVTAAGRTSALAAVAAVEVKGRAPKTGYSRDQFGQAWADVDHNGCDTRNDILARDLTGETFKPGTHNCVVLTGALAEPYSGTSMQFLRGATTSDDVQIDHVVALSDAWQKGAASWDVGRRTAFANDPLNLLAVQGTLNMQKGDGDAATWLPPNRSYRCAYVARQVAVKVTYGLWVTQAEKNAMATILASCPAEPLPGGVVANVPEPAPAPAPVPAPAPAPAPRPAPAPAPAPAPPPDAGVYYQNCSDVRAHGAAPIHPGDPGWDPKFDRDGDGIGCE